MQKAVDLICHQRGDHVSGVDADEAPWNLVQIHLPLHEEIAAQERAMDR
jgi:hypothetical protein